MLIGPRRASMKDSTPRALFNGGYKGVWYDFSDPSTMRSDAAGAQIADATGIYTLMDKSGNGNHLTQTTSGSRPTWNKAGYAGFVAASSQFMSRTDGIDFSPGGELPNQWSFMAWLSGASIGTTQYLFGLGSSASNNQVMAAGSNNTTASTLSAFIREDSGGASHSVNVAIQTGAYGSTPQMVSMTSVGPETGARWQAWLGMTRSTVIAPASYNGVHTFNRFALGALVRTTTGNYINANIYQFLLINRCLQQDEISRTWNDWKMRTGA